MILSHNRKCWGAILTVNVALKVKHAGSKQYATPTTFWGIEEHRKPRKARSNFFVVRRVKSEKMNWCTTLNSAKHELMTNRLLLARVLASVVLVRSSLRVFAVKHFHIHLLPLILSIRSSL